MIALEGEPGVQPACWAELLTERNHHIGAARVRSVEHALERPLDRDRSPTQINVDQTRHPPRLALELRELNAHLAGELAITFANLPR